MLLSLIYYLICRALSFGRRPTDNREGMRRVAPRGPLDAAPARLLSIHRLFPSLHRHRLGWGAGFKDSVVQADEGQGLEWIGEVSRGDAPDVVNERAGVAYEA